jgi:hypothetical protein
MTETFKYDVFISHSSEDKSTARELAERLKADGLRVWLDEWEIKPGDLVGLKIEEGLEQSRTQVLVMSADAFGIEWAKLERHTARFRDLQRAARRPFKKLLVAGRCDRGGLMVSRTSIERFQNERGFSHYLETSAQTGDGCDALRDAIIQNIPWGNIPWTASPLIFRLLKEEIVKLKEEGRVLLRMGELKQQLEMRLPGEAFTIEELRAVVGLLAGPGIVWQLEFGDFVLLQPVRRFIPRNAENRRQRDIQDK